MLSKSINELFKEHQDEFLKFQRIPPSRKLTARRDLHAFLLLDCLLPGKATIVTGAEHDQIWLDADTKMLAEKAHDADIIDLIRCGVRLDSDMLAMFV